MLGRSTISKFHGVPLSYYHNQQYGAGLGNIFGGLLRSAMPLLRQGLSYILPHAKRFGTRVLHDVAQGENLKSAIKQRGRQAIGGVAQGALKRVASSLDQSGSGGLEVFVQSKRIRMLTRKKRKSAPKRSKRRGKSAAQKRSKSKSSVKKSVRRVSTLSKKQKKNKRKNTKKKRKNINSYRDIFS